MIVESFIFVNPSNVSAGVNVSNGFCRHRSIFLCLYWDKAWEVDTENETCRGEKAILW